MTFTRTVLGAVFGLAFATSGAQAMPAGAGAATVDKAAASTLVEQVQYYYSGPRRYYGGPRYYGRGYGRGYRGNGVAAGVAAGALGALAIGGLAASGAFDERPAYAPLAPGRKQWCADRYRSYNPEDGTFVGRDGRVRYCG
ncbi:MAG: BA14K family protein [Bosea sp. (in: a-proteobacteria)]